MEKVTLRGTFGFCVVCVVLGLSRANAIHNSLPSFTNTNASEFSMLQASAINRTLPRQSPNSLDYPPHRYPFRPKHPFSPSKPEERRQSLWSFLNPVQAFKKLVEIISGEEEDSSKPTKVKYPYAEYRRRPIKSFPKQPTTTPANSQTTEAVTLLSKDRSTPSYSNPPTTTPVNIQTTEEAVTLSYEDQSRIIDQIVSSLTTESFHSSQVRPGNYGSAPVQPTFPTTASKFVTPKAPMTTPPTYNAAVTSDTSYAPTITVTPSYTGYRVPKLPAVTPSVPMPGSQPGMTYPIPDQEFRSLIPLLASGVLP